MGNNKSTEMTQRLYAVMRLNESIEIKTVYPDDVYEAKVSNEYLAGYIPVYRTHEEAMKHSGDSKYQIMELAPY